MIQITNLVGEVFGRTDKGGVIVNVHTHYATDYDVVVRDAYVTLTPSKYVKGPVFERLEKGNLVFAQGRFLGNEYGSPYISPDGDAVFILEADHIQLLAQVADEKRDSDFFQALLIGNLGKDGETRYTTTGKELQVSSMAVNHLEDGETTTVWFKLASWIRSKLGDSMKGTRAFVQGVPRFDEVSGGPVVWQNAAGEDRSNYEINVQRYIPFQKVEQSQQASHYDEPEDIPF